MALTAVGPVPMVRRPKWQAQWNLFSGVGTASIYNDTRTVRYLSHALRYAAVAGGSASTE